MRIARVSGSLLALGAAATFSAGCSAGPSLTLPESIGAPALHQLGRDAYAYRTIYAFRNSYRNGDEPNGQLAGVNGVLYGTTYFGGRAGASESYGTVFSLTRSGEERVIYKFKGGANGAAPNAGLVDVDGTLYGTTSSGGEGCLQNGGCGTVFSVTQSGQEHTLYRFKGGSDGISPAGGLVLLGGKLYGATSHGGSDSKWCADEGSIEPGCGTIFSVDTSGNERVLYRFRGKSDGVDPNAPLLAMNGKLYGTTFIGGAAGSCNYSCGTIFEVDTTGAERVLHRFNGSTDGSDPASSLTAIAGILYGTTTSSGVGLGCCGSVFKATTSGSETVIYSFKNLPDARSPRGTLVLDHGFLYGTAAGGKSCYEGYGTSGTAFAVSTSGKERVVHTFSCGASPSPSLLLLDRVLYGTTFLGGHAHGTAFAITE